MSQERYLNADELIMGIAQVAYDTYCESTGGKSAVTGAELPAFNDTPEAVKIGWVAAVLAVIELGN